MTSAPRIFTAGRIINSSSFNPEPFLPIRDAGEIRREIRWQKAAGVDFIKIYSSMTPELVKVAVDEAHANGLPVIGHLQRTTWTEAAKLGIDAIAHGASWSPEYLPDHKRAAYQQTMFGRVYWLNNIDLQSSVFRELTDALTAGQVSIDPTLIAYYTKFFGDQMRESPLVPASVNEHWKATAFTRDWSAEQFSAAQKAWPKMLALTRLLHDRGVLLTVGTDMPTPWIVPGSSLHEEMELLVSAGIAPAEVLKMATRNAATALRRQESIGCADAGCYADLVVLSRNPLDDIRNTRSIEMVFAGATRVLPRSAAASSRQAAVPMPRPCCRADVADSPSPGWPPSRQGATR
jgi:imidazolonepropionase-like amidohydrolase